MSLHIEELGVIKVRKEVERVLSLQERHSIGEGLTDAVIDDYSGCDFYVGRGCNALNNNPLKVPCHFGAQVGDCYSYRDCNRRLFSKVDPFGIL
ncbi:MAG: hypothetical protein KJ592_02405 [Nanoarchaeota archaeon]|nr:hypothetical protein [Nanoarchaeota archaeon]